MWSRRMQILRSKSWDERQLAPMQLHNDDEVAKWTRCQHVNHNPETDGSDFSWVGGHFPTTWKLESDDSDDPCSDGVEWRGRLRREIEHEIQLLKEPTPFEMVMEKRRQEY